MSIRRALRVDLKIEQGATYSKSLTVLEDDGSPRDFAEWTAKMQARRTYDAQDAALSIGTEIGGIQFDEPGKVTIAIPATVTEAIPCGVYVYDLKLRNGEYAERLIEGRLRVEPNATK